MKEYFQEFTCLLYLSTINLIYFFELRGEALWSLCSDLWGGPVNSSFDIALYNNRDESLTTGRGVYEMGKL